jgi:hypothetical protein
MGRKVLGDGSPAVTCKLCHRVRTGNAYAAKKAAFPRLTLGKKIARGLIK